VSGAEGVTPKEAVTAGGLPSTAGEKASGVRAIAIAQRIGDRRRAARRRNPGGTFEESMAKKREIES
jgi:hypothetical protein